MFSLTIGHDITFRTFIKTHAVVALGHLNTDTVLVSAHDLKEGIQICVGLSLR